MAVFGHLERPANEIAQRMIDLAERLEQRTLDDPASLPSVFPDLQNRVACFELLAEQIESGRQDACLRWEGTVGGDPRGFWVLLKLFIEDTAELIERGALGIVFPWGIVLPVDTIRKGALVRWFKTIGETVDRDEALFEISTDEIDAEIPTPVTGRLAAIFVREGETVSVNQVLAIIHTH